MSSLEHRIESSFKCLIIDRKQVPDWSQKWLWNKNDNNKRFIGKATSHNDHYMTNMGSQMEKINGNWLLQALICSGDSVVASLTKSYKSFLLNLPQ